MIVRATYLTVNRRGLGRSARVALLASMVFSVAEAQSTDAPLAAYPDPPQTVFKDLFIAVQSAQVFADAKAFPDAIPNWPPNDILMLYHGSEPDSPRALERFVTAHFALPPTAASVSSSPDQVSLVKHIDALWDQLTRNTPSAPRYSSLLPLPHAYVVPGGRFREIYYWDSYFTMLGLEESGRRDLVTGMIDDFSYLIDTYGHVPNGTRTYYLSRSQPPFFFEMAALSSGNDPARAYAHYLAELKREYAFWMEGAEGLRPGSAYRRVVAMPNGSILNRYWDDSAAPRDEAFYEDTELALKSGRKPQQLYRDIRAAAESGWDFSSRWFGDAKTRAAIDTTEIVPVDLNSLLFGLENAIRAGCERQGDAACAKTFAARSAARRVAIDRYLWDESRGAYFDYGWTHRSRRFQLTAATLYPLFVRLARQHQAALVGKTLSRSLLKPGGLVTTLLDTGEQWDAPNGWAPLQWIAVEGLRHYGSVASAEAIACRWMVSVNDVYRKSGKLVEKYDVIHTGRAGGGGEYPTQDGFGWTNGVTRKFIALYPADAAFTAPSQCPKPSIPEA